MKRWKLSFALLIAPLATQAGAAHSIPEQKHFVTPLTDVTYQKLCTHLAKAQTSEDQIQKTLEVISTEAGKELLKLVVTLEASQKVFSGTSFPDELLVLEQNAHKFRKQQNEGLSLTIAGTITGLVGGALALSAVKPTVRIYGAGSIGSGFALGGSGSSRWYDAEAGLSTNEANNRELKAAFFNSKLDLQSIVEFWKNILNLSTAEAIALRNIIENEISKLITAKQLGKNVINLDQINIVDLLKQHEIGSQDMVLAVEKVQAVILKNDAGVRPTVNRDFVEAQLQAISDIIDVLQPSAKTNSIHQGTLDQARIRLGELQSTLKTVTLVDCKNFP